MIEMNRDESLEKRENRLLDSGYETGYSDGLKEGIKRGLSLAVDLNSVLSESLKIPKEKLERVSICVVR